MPTDKNFTKEMIDAMCNIWVDLKQSFDKKDWKQVAHFASCMVTHSTKVIELAKDLSKEAT